MSGTFASGALVSFVRDEDPGRLAKMALEPARDLVQRRPSDDGSLDEEVLGVVSPLGIEASIEAGSRCNLRCPSAFFRMFSFILVTEVRRSPRTSWVQGTRPS